ncbi:MAG: C45 family peptidase [Myxococcota bacterium]
MIPRVQVDLAQAPALRWRGLAPHRQAARAMADSYLKDLGGMANFAPLLGAYRAGFVRSEYGEEMDAVAELIGRPAEQVLLANLYYDAFRALVGCTAFAIDTESGPIHGRNLDWWTEKNMLAKHTQIAEFRGGSAPGPYASVGWPAFIGVFSAVAQGRFAISLNAVLSDETPTLAESIALLLRRVFDTVPSFDAAVELLSTAPIAADCLLLVTGTKAGEMVVVERTSTRAAVRTAENGFIVVTNDYRSLDGGFASLSEGALHATACSRFDRASYLVLDRKVASFGAGFDILTDAKVKMDITVQHMLMQAATGALEVRLPSRR